MLVNGSESSPNSGKIHAHDRGMCIKLHTRGRENRLRNGATPPMRLEDILLLLSLLAVSGIYGFGRAQGRIWRLLSILILAAFLVGQIAFRRFYWQLFPADAALIILLVFCIFFHRIGTFSSKVVAALTLILTEISLVFLIVLPLFRLPAPSGPYIVGTRILCLVDSSRADHSFPSGHRELMVQVWYPAADAAQPVASYRRWKETTLLSSYDAFLKTHSHLNAPVASHEVPYPVLLFNPAWGGSRTQNTYQTEFLASHGYIVIAIDHTHNSSLVAFPNGQVVKAAPVQAIDDFTNSTFDKQKTIAEHELDTQAKDDIFVLNSFAAMNENPHSPWFHSLDMNRVGAFGHSFGGATSIEACFRDPRIDAAMNMDGWIYGHIATSALDKPLFVMYEQGWPPDTQAYIEEAKSTQPYARTDIWDLHNLRRTMTEQGGYVLTLDHTRHMNFSDRSLYSPIRKLTDSGSMNPILAHSIINQYTLAFFDHVLKGRPEALLNPAHQPLADASFKEWPRPHAAETIPSSAHISASKNRYEPSAQIAVHTAHLDSPPNH